MVITWCLTGAEWHAAEQANTLLCDDEEGGVAWLELMTTQAKPPEGQVSPASHTTSHHDHTRASGEVS